VVNVVNGFGRGSGASRWPPRSRIAKIAFNGETTTGRLIMQLRQPEPHPGDAELGRQEPELFFSDIAAARDDFYDKALEGFTMFALNQGEVCTCPSGPWSRRTSTTSSCRTPSNGPRRSGRVTRWTSRR